MSSLLIQVRSAVRNDRTATTIPAIPPLGKLLLEEELVDPFEERTDDVGFNEEIVDRLGFVDPVEVAKLPPAVDCKLTKSKVLSKLTCCKDCLGSNHRIAILKAVAEHAICSGCDIGLLSARRQNGAADRAERLFEDIRTTETIIRITTKVVVASKDIHSTGS
jgi:hypothetical protein